MDVINKLYSSVSSTVSQISSSILGNPLCREFYIDTNGNEIGSSGIGLFWKIFNGYKKTTKQEVSIFVFEKKQLDRWQKDDREAMIDILRKGVVQLTKIKHPHILTVQQPLEESREVLAFASEPIYASLANILEAKLGAKESKLYEVEIKYGILQLAEGLQFLHSDVKLIHRNINPSSVIINKNGAWKIFGFDFCALNDQPNSPNPHWPFIEYNQTWHVLSQPLLDYMAPEYTLQNTHTPSSDLYSLGVLIYTIYADGGKPIRIFGQDYSAFKRFANDLKSGKKINLSCIPEGLRESVKLMLSVAPEMRPDIHTLRKIPFFDDVGVKSLSYLDSLFQWDNLQKSKFFKGLPQIIKIMPHRINLFRILPCLVKEFVNPPMIPFVLTNCLLIAENCTKKEFNDHVWNHLKPVMKLNEPIQILLIFMQKMELLLKLTTPEDVKSDVLPLLYRAIECSSPQIQELCLSIIPSFAALIDYPSMKNALLPRIKKLCIQTIKTSVKVNCLITIGKLLPQLDKWLVLDEILPFLPKINSREPAVIMAIIGIYRIVLSNDKLGMTKEVISTNVIPFLSPLCIENGLSLNQFQAIMTLMKELIERVETEQKTKLEQINILQKESKGLDLSDTDNWMQGGGDDSLFRELEQNNASSKPVRQEISSPVNSFPMAPNILDNQRMNVPIAIPTPSLNQNKPATKVKDLTSTLIESNLNQLNIGSKSFNTLPNLPINPTFNNNASNMMPMMQNNWQQVNCNNSNLMNLSMSQSNFSVLSDNKNTTSSKTLTTEEIMDFLK